MSAIFGIYNLNGEPAEKTYLLKMREKTARYGRDGQDFVFGGNIGLGCCLSKFGAYSQNDVPVYHDENAGLTLVCDALIWNRTELLNKLGLGGDVSIQAIILEAYIKWGEDCPKDINGDFSFAIWDKEKNQLFLARDHLGVRPFFYYFDGSVFAFATDYRALLSLPFVGKQLDEVKVYSELSGTYHIDPESTYFEKVKRLPQAHTLRISAKGFHKCKYWSPCAGGRIIYKTEAEYVKAFYDIVDDAIKLRINGVSGKIGSELSGGLDSSVITILANRELVKAGRKMEALFSWSPPFKLIEKQPEDERVLIESVCRQEGLSCAYYDPDEPLNNTVRTPPETQGINEIMNHELNLLSLRGVKHILSGWGGDDAVSLRAGLYQILLRGYVGYFIKQTLWLAKGSPLRLIKIIASNTVMQWFRPFARFGNPNKGQPDIMKREFRQRLKKRCGKDILYFSVDPIKHIQSGVIQTRTELTAYLDAECGIQHLYPFLDYRAVDFAFSIPRYMYYKDGVNRYIFRKAFAGILPREFGGYFTKDDPAKSDFLTGRLTEEKIKKAAGLINRELFSPYIDWNRFDEAVSLISPEKAALRLRLTLNRKTWVCLDIEQVLTDIGGF
ncbi:MAG: asparagine synthase-related protein [Clostridiaceae bacterium]|nr:asparagine synthase-related protein [Clostridiaceae bacterium]